VPAEVAPEEVDGVQIMTSAYEGDPKVPKVVPREQWYLAPARAAEEGGR
jgi:hypothetical protein